jgi:GMP synthase (glutamine-hydrolysing)
MTRPWAPRTLVLQHEADTPPGLIGSWLEEQSAHVKVVRIDEVGPDPDPRAHDLIVSLGSEHSAYDDSTPFVARESELLSAAFEADVPILGVCFGGQLLARVLGADVRRAAHPEVGWYKVQTRDEALVESGPWLQWHFDAFPLPPDARLVAESPMGVQAFVARRCLGLQFHPEVTAEIVDGWIRGYPEGLGAYGIDLQRVGEETRMWEAANRQAAWRLLDSFRDQVATGTVTR